MNELTAKEALRIIEILMPQGWTLEEVIDFIKSIING